MNEIWRDTVKWLIGGGALALATLLGTTAYQQGQLEIEREKNLRVFLDKYVQIAVKGSFDERLRFVQYWESLAVKDQIGVDFGRYKAALNNELNILQKDAEAGVAAVRQATVESPAPVAAEPVASRRKGRQPASVTEPPPQQQIAQTPSREQQQAYYAVRQSSVDRLSVPDLEKQGFEALLNRDFSGAEQALSQAVRLWPEYHNVAEVRKLLLSNQAKLKAGDDQAWKEIYAAIIGRYSWGLSPIYLTRVREALKK
jgi:hypothetical protein